MKHPPSQLLKASVDFTALLNIRLQKLIPCLLQKPFSLSDYKKYIYDF